MKLNVRQAPLTAKGHKGQCHKIIGHKIIPFLHFIFFCFFAFPFVDETPFTICEKASQLKIIFERIFYYLLTRHFETKETTIFRHARGARKHSLFFVIMFIFYC